MELFVVGVVVVILIIALKAKKKSARKIEPLSEKHKKYLLKTVEFYRELTLEERIQFEKRVQLFLLDTNVTGIDTEVNEYDKLLVASSAIIPVFAFPDWEYRNLREVLIYPGSFNEKFIVGQPDSLISGMVGTGYMEGKMILSKPALHQGFQNPEDKKNVGIHEFVHLIDKADGEVDGIPQALVDKQFAIPWMGLVKHNMDQIHDLNSDINSYGGVDKREFFSVISEYFFERPKLLKIKHPKLYESLNEIFTTDLAKKYKGITTSGEPNRNDKCLCGSGKKYKHCCLALNSA